MTAPAILGHGEGAEGDPGPSVIAYSPGLPFTDRHQAITITVRRSRLVLVGEGEFATWEDLPISDEPFRVVAVFQGQAEELVWAGAFVAPYAKRSTIAGDVLTVRRSTGWPPGVGVGLRVDATGEGHSANLGGA